MKTSRTAVASVSALLATALLTGCGGFGMSPRESGAHTQGRYLSALATDLSVDSAGVAKPFAGPASIAVAQVGEMSPPEGMMNELRAEKTLFSRVQAIPATDPDLYSGNYQRYPQQDDGASSARRGITGLRSLAAATGADYLLLVGGTVDQTSHGTPASALNLTIVGMFIVPSQQTRALMKASGAMIDVKTGALVALSTADREETRWLTYAGQDGEAMEMLGSMRDKLTVKLAKQVIADCKQSATAATRIPMLPATASRE